MRILLVYAAADWSVVDVSSGYEDALRTLGHEVKIFRLSRRIDFWSESLEHWANIHGEDPPDVHRVLRETCDWVLVEAARFKPDLVLITSAMGFHPDALQLLKEAGYPIAVACSESPYDDVHHAQLAPLVHWLFVNDRNSVEALEPFNPGNVYYLPTAYSESVHRPGLPWPSTASVEAPLETDVLFIGTGFGERQRFLEEALRDPAWPLDASIQFHGFFGFAGSSADPDQSKNQDLGDNWENSPMRPYCFPPVTNDETAARYCRAKVVLNLYRDGAGYSMNPRAYEIAACGAFQLAQDVVQEAHDVFGNSIGYFTTPHDLAIQVALYLKDGRARVQMARLSMKRVQGHSYTDRARALLSVVAPPEPPVGLSDAPPVRYGESLVRQE